MAPIIEMKNIHKSFGRKEVLKDFSLSVEKGESLVILGASGAGKSVALKLILGLEKPNRGEVVVRGGPIGMLFQNGALFDSLSVWENVSFELIENQGWDDAKARAFAIKTLAEVGLPESVADMPPSDLSGGMKKRVGLARAIAASPEIILFDEPTTGLDPIMSEVINSLIAKNVRRMGATAITITHDLLSARKIADRIVMLEEGRIAWSGPPCDLKDAKDPYVRKFVRAAG
jgi:phospholipid/cholesterol/gamma-HCH transport system ATP-binding protein